MAETNCQMCGERVVYEPIMVGAVDLGRQLHRHCERCLDVATEAEMLRKRAERHIELKQMVRRTIPPELLPKELDPLGTDTEHPEFYGEMWKVLRKWRPGPHGNWIGLIGPSGQCKTRCLGLLAARFARPFLVMPPISPCTGASLLPRLRPRRPPYGTRTFGQRSRPLTTA